MRRQAVRLITMSDEDRMVTSEKEEDDEDEGPAFNLEGFLYGNVDSLGQSEVDYMDEVWLAFLQTASSPSRFSA